MNPYLEALHTHTTKNSTGDWQNKRITTQDGETWLRKHLTRKYAWAIPNNTVITRLTEHAPLIEIGAGNGFWASIVREQNGVITPIEPDPPTHTWTSLTTATHTAISSYSDHALLLCWPSYGADWPVETLTQYEGDTLIYIGDGRGGVTGSPELHRTIDEEFGLATDVITIPSWHGVTDNAYIFTR